MSTVAAGAVQSPEPVAVDPVLLAGVLSDLGAGLPAAIVAMDGGSSPVFRIDLVGGGAMTLKTYDKLSHEMPVREAYAAGLLRHLDLPVTRYLALDEIYSRLPFRFAITNHLPGVTVGSLKDEPDIADLYRQMGMALRQLHTVSLPGYGPFGDGSIAELSANHATYIRGLAAHAFGQFRHYGGDEALALQLQSIVSAFEPITAHSLGAVFAHDDLHPNNVLAERDASGRLQLTGVIDFGNARAADPISDLAKTLFCCEHEAPGSSAPILEGYGPIAHPNPQAALWVYTLVHRVIMWWWLRSIGVIADGEEHDLIADLRAMATSGTYAT
ncbi:MAG: phosphotransferase family protein [Cypionkella sp.]